MVFINFLYFVNVWLLMFFEKVMLKMVIINVFWFQFFLNGIPIIPRTLELFYGGIKLFSIQRSRNFHSKFRYSTILSF